jgi:hypothetical protein
MTTSIDNKFGRELNSFFSLVILNIVFSGIAMALSISFTVQNIVAAIGLIPKEVTLTWAIAELLSHPQFLFGVLGVIAAVLSLKWLIASTEIMSDVEEIHSEYKEKSKQLDSNTVTSLIVKTMAYYRDKKNAIQSLSLFSRIGGFCFIASAALQAFYGTFTVNSEWALLMVATSVALCLAVGMAGVLIPRYFSNFSATWEIRLKESVKVEQELKKMLETS